MNFKKLIPAALAAFIVLFVLDYLWFGLILNGFYMRHMTWWVRESVPLHALAELCLGTLMAMIYPMGYKGGNPVMEGAKFGFIIGLIYELPFAIHQQAEMGGTLKVPVTFIVNGIIICMLAGITVAMIYGNKIAATNA